jgi:hypothetical protein
VSLNPAKNSMPTADDIVMLKAEIAKLKAVEYYAGKKIKEGLDGAEDARNIARENMRLLAYTQGQRAIVERELRAVMKENDSPKAEWRQS